jgi:NTP pyrophosphatase (non-canonical NTP hydrolase)
MEQNENYFNPELNELFDLVRDWAYEKGIYKNGDIKTQTLKLVEEVGELSKAVLKEDNLEIEDAIGDCIVVLINIAELYSIKENTDLKAEDFLLNVFKVISKRTGEMRNGTFIKD